MPKVLKTYNERNQHYGYAFYCPGCKHYHVYWTEMKAPNGALWHFSGDMDNPTFTASLLQTIPGDENYRCHLFVKNGNIEFLGDCSHELRGQTVPMEEENE